MSRAPIRAVVNVGADMGDDEEEDTPVADAVAEDIHVDSMIHKTEELLSCCFVEKESDASFIVDSVVLG